MMDILQKIDNALSTEETVTIDSGCFQICIKNLKGTDFTMMVKPSDSITKIKDKIEDLTGVPKATQRLIAGGKELKDAMTVATAGIKSNNVIHLAHRLRGGFMHANGSAQSS